MKMKMDRAQVMKGTVENSQLLVALLGSGVLPTDYVRKVVIDPEKLLVELDCPQTDYLAESEKVMLVTLPRNDETMEAIQKATKECVRGYTMSGSRAFRRKDVHDAKCAVWRGLQRKVGKFVRKWMTPDCSRK